MSASSFSWTYSACVVATWHVQETTINLASASIISKGRGESAESRWSSGRWWHHASADFTVCWRRGPAKVGSPRHRWWRRRQVRGPRRRRRRRRWRRPRWRWRRDDIRKKFTALNNDIFQGWQVRSLHYCGGTQTSSWRWPSGDEWCAARMSWEANFTPVDAAPSPKASARPPLRLLLVLPLHRHGQANVIAK